jgi:hypothetical protein
MISIINLLGFKIWDILLEVQIDGEDWAIHILFSYISFKYGLTVQKEGN